MSAELDVIVDFSEEMVKKEAVKTSPIQGQNKLNFLQGFRTIDYFLDDKINYLIKKYRKNWIYGFWKMFKERSHLATAFMWSAEPEWSSGFQRCASCSTDGRGFEPQTSTNACGHVGKYVDQKAWLPCWPLYSQQVSHQWWIWGSLKWESRQGCV